MLTKAGVPTYKIILGVMSYGRSFRMADSSCSGPMCTYLGGYGDSKAAKGPCTDTGGYISDVEIRDVLDNADDFETIRSWHDSESDSDILVYGDKSGADWVAWMDIDTKSSRFFWTIRNNLGGTVDWAIDLETETGRRNDSDNPIDLPDPDFSCPEGKRPKSLEALASAVTDRTVEPVCRSLYSLSILSDDLDQAIKDYNETVSDYDPWFGPYADWIEESVDPSLRRFMKMGSGPGNKYFYCSVTVGVGTIARAPCTDVGDWEAIPSAYWDITYELKDEKGFYEALYNDYGIERSWVKFGDIDDGYQCASNPFHSSTGGSGPWARVAAAAGTIGTSHAKRCIQSATDSP